MGFMGISISESDTALDFTQDVGNRIAKMLRAQLKIKNNEFNTDGNTNAAMFLDEVIIPSEAFLFNEDLRAVSKIVLQNLRKRVDWKDRNVKLDKDYKKLISSISKFVTEGDKSCPILGPIVQR